MSAEEIKQEILKEIYDPLMKQGRGTIRPEDLVSKTAEVVAGRLASMLERIEKMELPSNISPAEDQSEDPGPWPPAVAAMEKKLMAEIRNLGTRVFAKPEVVKTKVKSAESAPDAPSKEDQEP